MNKKGFGSIVIIIMTLVTILIFGSLIIGIHIKTTEGGKHTGYVTAIETNGIIFKTHSAYFKSELESSQEDRYCIIDSKIKEELAKLSKEKTRVTIYYYDYLAPGLNYCKFDDIGIIDNWDYSPGGQIAV